MTVWSMERMSDVKKLFQLPRARSTQQRLLPVEARAGADSTTTTSFLSRNGSTPLPSTVRPTSGARPGPSLRHCSPATARRADLRRLAGGDSCGVDWRAAQLSSGPNAGAPAATRKALLALDNASFGATGSQQPSGDRYEKSSRRACSNAKQQDEGCIAASSSSNPRKQVMIQHERGSSSNSSSRNPSPQLLSLPSADGHYRNPGSGRTQQLKPLSLPPNEDVRDPGSNRKQLPLLPGEKIYNDPGSSRKQPSKQLCVPIEDCHREPVSGRKQQTSRSSKHQTSRPSSEEGPREVVSDRKQLARQVLQMSSPSEEALNRLNELDTRLSGIEQQVEQLRNQLTNESEGLTVELLGQKRAALAQLEADAYKLETAGIDCIFTSGLRSGQASAKEAKKAQLFRLEQLYGKIEELFRALNASARLKEGKASQ